MNDRRWRGEPIVFIVDGEPVSAFAGQTVAAALLAAGQRAFRITPQAHAPRGVFCGMGVCFDCLVTVDGKSNVRACITPVEAGMRIETGRGCSR